MRNYTITEKRRERDYRQTNWGNRLTVFKMRNAGKTFREIAATVGSSRQCVHAQYKKMCSLTPSELNRLISSDVVKKHK